jgi:hypothetical protein
MQVTEQLGVFVCGALASIVGVGGGDSKVAKRQRIRNLLKVGCVSVRLIRASVTPHALTLRVCALPELNLV